MHTVDDVQLLKRCLTMAGYSVEGLGGVSDEWSHEDVMRGARKMLCGYLKGWERIAELEAQVAEHKALAEMAWETNRREYAALYKEAQAAHARVNAALAHLGNLLAVIHRDGGQYQARHGAERAVQEAMRISSERIGAEAERDAARKELAEWEEQEASVCPEDVGFVEYIKHLTGNLDALRQELDGVLKMIGVEASPNYEKLEADNARLREASKWQPISSAPKDGTHILAWDGNQHFGISPPTVVHWFEDGFYTSVNELDPEHTYKAVVWTNLNEFLARAALAQTEKVKEPDR